VTISYVDGDATRPEGDGPKIICHVCNDIGAWGRGFVLAVSARWPEPEAQYRAWHRLGNAGGFSLGAVQFVKVDAAIAVANMVGQRGLGTSSIVPPIRYDAVAACLRKVADKALETGASVHMPRIGCGLAGGEWSRIEPLLQKNLCDRGISVTVYDWNN
jgi:O-acetyl-ADP-ribose deacetylase (regulator of RNase III)